jgi:predicted RNase H-like HicB family nuclease
MKKVKAIIERGADGLYSIYTPTLKNNIIGEGATVAEAKQDFLIGYQEIIDTYKEDGKRLPRELNNIEFVYQYDLAAFYQAHPYLNVSKIAQFTGINDTLMRQYKRGQYISETQILRIQNGIRAIGKELSNTTLVK